MERDDGAVVEEIVGKAAAGRADGTEGRRKRLGIHSAETQVYSAAPTSALTKPLPGRSGVALPSDEKVFEELWCLQIGARAEGGDSLRWSGLVRSAFPQRCAGARRWGTPRRCGLSPNAASGLSDGGPDRRQGGGPQRDKGEGWTPDGGQAQEEWDGPQPLVPFEIPRA